MTKYVEWLEPHNEKGVGGYLPIICRATVEDIAKYRRAHEPRYTSDEEAVEDFLVVYWGQYKEYND